ncbi:MAG: lysophospholipid acyltransferase family protein [Desulfobacteraceae bacterium]|nr:MAG: lysophospholipid acyltransferase family protein [Desulfobacteraceae bacterium]
MESKSPEKIRLRWYDPILLRALPPLAALLIKLLMLSCRVIKMEGKEKVEEALSQSGGRAVYATWHQRLAYHYLHLRNRNVTIMISQSRDGEYGERVAGLLGFKGVRGSSTRGGRKALEELTQRIRQGESGGMLADGPLGPARVAKMGSVVMARNAQAPLIPVVWGADRCWIFNSWDRQLVPKPFARGVIYFAEPIWIPHATQGEDLEAYRRLFEERLNQGTRWCDEQFGPERPWRKVKEKGIPEVGPL